MKKAIMKKFVVHVTSESSDDYYMQFDMAQAPKNESEWLKLIVQHYPELDSRETDGEGPGVDGHWINVNHVHEVT